MGPGSTIPGPLLTKTRHYRGDSCGLHVPSLVAEPPAWILATLGGHQSWLRSPRGCGGVGAALAGCQSGHGHCWGWQSRSCFGGVPAEVDGLSGGRSAGECQRRASDTSKVDGEHQNEHLSVTGQLGRRRARKMVPASTSFPRESSYRYLLLWNTF